MSRIEQILKIVDQPGKPKKIRFRQLKYTLASSLAEKVKNLSDQLGTVSISVSATTTQPQQPQPDPRSRSRSPRVPPGRTAPPAQVTPTPTTTAGPSVYLDADERTNRILMIGFDEQLDIVEGLIDTLDVEQKILRTIRVYEIQHVDAEEVSNKLAELGVISGGGGRTTSSRRDSTTARAQSRSTAAREKAPTPAPGAEGEDILAEEPRVVVIETTNSLLVNATPEQHDEIATLIGYIDSETIEKAIPFEIYGLENVDPEGLAKVLNELIQETVQDKEGKIEKVIKREEDIVIVPDSNTFSLIVYASRKNQEWVSKLIKDLDKRRPQVLIQVALVEITKNSDFEYDLKVIGNAKDPVVDNVGILGANTDVFGTEIEGGWNINNFGKAVGFYAEDQIQMILEAIDSKQYGRVLAKPKVLVNDNELGKINTSETTFVKTETQSFPGEGTTPVTTAEFTPYDAKIELNITPNISEGNLLRLEVEMIREDLVRKGTDIPPDYVRSNVNTIVTVPDGSTIILGGLTKLNQSKSNSKVPILGDVPIVGTLFRTVANNDNAKKLYYFVKADILRPDETEGLAQLEEISARSKLAFEKDEQDFQNLKNFPGLKPEPMDPLKVLESE